MADTLDDYDLVLDTPSPGEYWLATDELTDDTGDPCSVVQAGRMYLVEAVLRIESSTPIVCLRHHPLSTSLTHRIAIDRFLGGFTRISDDEVDAIRNTEVAAVQAAISREHEAIRELNQDGEAVVRRVWFDSASNLLGRATLPAPDTQAASPTLGDLTRDEILDVQRRSKNQRKVAEARSRLVHAHSARIHELAISMAHFHTERADACALAAQAGAGRIDELSPHLHLLSLYSGEHVTTQRLVRGSRASGEHGFDIRQRRLDLDEESTIDLALGGPGFSSLNELAQALQQDSARMDRILPGPRCIAAIGLSADEKDQEPDTERPSDRSKPKIVILVRNGRRVDAVISPIVVSSMLFPGADPAGGPFCGADGRSIPLNERSQADVIDPDEAAVQTYCELLILLWGLYDRGDLIGPFDIDRSQKNLNLLDKSTQNALFCFIPDMDPDYLALDGLLPTPAFIRSRRSGLVPGSRVSVNWHAAMNPTRAPGCFSSAASSRGEQQRFPLREASVESIARRGDEWLVRVSTRHITTYSNRQTLSVVLFDEQAEYAAGEDDTCLVLDGLISEDIVARLRCPQARESFSRYMPMLIAAYHDLVSYESKLKGITAMIVRATGEGDLLCRRMLMQEMASRRWAETKKLTPAARKQLIANVAHAVRVCATLGLDYRLDPYIAQAEEPLGEALQPLNYLREPSADDIVRVTSAGRGRIGVYSRPKSRIGEELGSLDAFGWLERRVYLTTLLGGQVLVEDLIEGSETSLGYVSPGEITLWQRDHWSPTDRAAARDGGRPAIDDARLVSTWIAGRRRVPALPISQLREQINEMQSRGRAMVDELAAMDDALNDQWLDACQDALEANEKRRTILVGAPVWRLPLALICRRASTGHTPPRELYMFEWLFWSADAISLCHNLGGGSHRRRAIDLTNRYYLYPESRLENLQAEPELGYLERIPLSTTCPTTGVVEANSEIGKDGRFYDSLKRVSALAGLSIVVSLIGESRILELFRATRTNSLHADETVKLVNGSVSCGGALSHLG